MRNLCPRYWPSNWQSWTTDKMSQQFSSNFPMHHCIIWDILSPGRKWDILSDGTICLPKNASWTMVFLHICRRYAQKLPKICLRYAQALPKVWGFILRKWDKMSPGRVHQLGQYVSGEVHNAVGQFVLGTKCLLTLLYFPFTPMSYICWQHLTRTLLM